jgi:hypothetical protein
MECARFYRHWTFFGNGSFPRHICSLVPLVYWPICLTIAIKLVPF